MQGATLNVSGTAIITNIQRGQSDDWVTAELAEAPASNTSSNGKTWDLLPLKVRVRVTKGTQMPTEGSIIEIRSASLSRSEGMYKDKPTPFWNVAVFSWRELAAAPAAQSGTRPSGPSQVSVKPTTKRPVMDDESNIGGDWDDVPF